ncbi:hypothetical protein BHM03_00015872 [Ensete ventricosum]|nr:hypothetical protein BHM03_00015872 [Ensete ventricosum]
MTCPGRPNPREISPPCRDSDVGPTTRPAHRRVYRKRRNLPPLRGARVHAPRVPPFRLPFFKYPTCHDGSLDVANSGGPTWGQRNTWLVRRVLGRSKRVPQEPLPSSSDPSRPRRVAPLVSRQRRPPLRPKPRVGCGVGPKWTRVAPVEPKGEEEGIFW